jgi:hypothetical protein
MKRFIPKTVKTRAITVATAAVIGVTLYLVGVDKQAIASTVNLIIGGAP